jgi:Thioesterase-like superfamily
MSKGLIDLISILDLEPIEVNMFRGNSPKTSWQRVFGGQVIGQALVAACRTVEGRLPHSLHCYFILPGDPQIPIIYEVERLRDGKSYSTRRVTAIQHGEAIFSIMVSFHVEEQGSFDHQDKMPDVPPPEKLTAEEVAKQPMFREMPDFIRRYYESDRPIELRPVELGRYFGQKIEDGRIHVWIRTASKLSDDPALLRIRSPDRAASGRARPLFRPEDRGRPHPRLDPHRVETVRRSGVAYVRAGLCVGFLAARCGDGALRPHPVRQTHDAGKPRSRDVVSPSISCRRMAALCPGLTERAGRPRPDPRHDLQAGRHAGGLGGAGRLGSRTQVMAFRRWRAHLFQPAQFATLASG